MVMAGNHEHITLIIIYIYIALFLEITPSAVTII